MSRSNLKIQIFFWQIAILLITTAGCGYGKVEPVTYEYAQALYAICNQKDEIRLEEFAVTIQELTTSGEMLSSESKFLSNIIKKARAGEWEAGMLECRKIMEDQIR